MKHAANLHAPGTGLRGGGLFAAGLALVLLAAACKPATPPEAAPPAAPPPAAAQPATATSGPVLDPAAAPPTAAGTDPVAVVDSQWQCGDQRVAARFDNAARTVSVVHDRGEVVLPQAVAASGARYADDNGNEFWTKGASGTLTLSGTPARECSEVAAGG